MALSTVEDFRRRLAEGKVKSGGSKHYADIGNFMCTIETAEFGKGQRNNERGCVTYKILQAVDALDVGTTFNYYFQVSNEEGMERVLAEWTARPTAENPKGGHIFSLGIPEEKIFTPDADSLARLIENLMFELKKLARTGAIRIGIERARQVKNGVEVLDSKTKRPYYWNNIRMVELAAVSAPITFTQPAAAQAAPVYQPPVQPAPVAAPVYAAPVAPVQPAPVYAAPVAPVQPAPVAPVAPVVQPAAAPVTPAPVYTAPVTQAPVYTAPAAAPVQSAPVVPAQAAAAPAATVTFPWVTA
jgi:hypothetical protein